VRQQPIFITIFLSAFFVARIETGQE
jgi:hypothetical protein